MNKSIIACSVALAILSMTGCDKFIAPTGVNSANALTRYVDKENGVICYQAGDKTLSCVKVDGVAK